MTRHINDRLRLFLNHHLDLRMGSGYFRLHVNRIALTMDQIREYNPPPNPAKITDARASGYIARYGNESWELDALEPSALSALIRGGVEPLIDTDAWKRAVSRTEEGRRALGLISARWHEVMAFLENPEQ